MVYFVIAMALFSDAAYREVLQNLVESLRGLRAWADHWQVPTRTGISLARQRLSVEPLRELFKAVVQPIGTAKTRGAWYRGKRVVALDGTTLDAADSKENAAFFGRPGSSRGEQSGFPQVRVVSLVECGTHVHFDYALRAYPETVSVFCTLRCEPCNTRDWHQRGTRVWGFWIGS